MNYFKKAVIPVLLVIVLVQGAFILFTISSTEAYTELKSQAMTIVALQKLKHTVQQNGSDYAERAIVISLAANAVKLENIIKNNETVLSKDTEEHFLKFAKSALNESPQPQP